MSSWTAACQASLSFIISWSLLKLMSIESVTPSNHLILCQPLLFLLSIFHHDFFPQWFGSLFQVGSQSIGASASASVLPMNIQHWFSLGLAGLIPLLSKALLKVFYRTTVWSINSSVLSLVYGPTLTSVHNYWENHSCDYTDLCHQSDVSAF